MWFLPRFCRHQESRRRKQQRLQQYPHPQDTSSSVEELPPSAMKQDENTSRAHVPEQEEESEEEEEAAIQPDPRFVDPVAIVATDEEHQQFQLDRNLFMAVIRGDASQVKALLEQGASPWSMSWQMRSLPVSTLLGIAAWKGNIQVTQSIVTRSKRWLGVRLRRDFLTICELQSGDRLRLLLRHYGHFLAQSIYYEGSFTPLHYACMTCNFSAIEVLSNAGASWRARVEGSGATPLHVLASRFVRGYFFCNMTGRYTDGVDVLEWIWENHASLLFVEDSSERTALQCILGRLGLEAQRVCVLHMLSMRRGRGEKVD